MVKKANYNCDRDSSRSRSPTYRGSTAPASRTMMPSLPAPQPKTWTIGPAIKAADGAINTFPLSNGGVDITIAMHGCLAPFDASSLSDGPRKNLLLRLPPVWEASWERIDADIVALAQKHATTLFGQALSVQDLSGRYKPVTDKKGEYARQLKAKLVTEGFHAARFWDQEKHRTDPTISTANCTYNVVVKVRALWVGTDNFGLVVDTTDLQSTDVAECPF
jgi:hypothetical protein